MQVFSVILHRLLCASSLVFLLGGAGWASAHEGLPDFTRLVEKAAPGVVNIRTSKQQDEMPAMQPDGELPEEFSEFLRRFWGQQMPPRERDHRAMGSGFFISGEGHILTNYHVVKDADEIIVRLSDRRELVAEFVGGDERSDIALIKVAGQSFPVLPAGSSAALKVGEWVVAIGSPFGFDYTVTAGIVSAKGRNLPRENYVPFIQTDVAINPGNSGGPLFNLKGEVVGVNSQIFTRGGGSIGLSFAIPMDVALDVARQLRETGQVARGWLGVQIQEVNRDLAESFGLDKPVGALVAQVFGDTPAEASGLREGDVILRFDGQEVELSADLPHIVGATRPGKRVPVEIIRARKNMTIKVVVGELPEEEPILARAEPPAEEPGPLGLRVTDLDRDQRDQLDAEHGVLVQRVMPGPAADAGINRGDVITNLNGEAVRSRKDLERISARLPGGKAIPVRVIRNGSPFFVSLRVGD